MSDRDRAQRIAAELLVLPADERIVGFVDAMQRLMVELAAEMPRGTPRDLALKAKRIAEDTMAGMRDAERLAKQRKARRHK